MYIKTIWCMHFRITNEDRTVFKNPLKSLIFNFHINNCNFRFLARKFKYFERNLVAIKKWDNFEGFLYILNGLFFN